MKPKYLIILPLLTWGGTYMFYEIPLGVGYISATLKKLGYEGELININEYDLDYVNKILPRKVREADVVLCGGLSSHFRSIRNIISLARLCKPSITVVTGGGMVSAQPETTASVGADIGIIGEGELAIEDLFSRLQRGQGIQKGSYIKASSYVDMDTLPLPDYEGLIEPGWMDKQRPTSNTYTYPFNNPRALPLVTTRGCPFNCSFCFSPLGRTYRERSIPKVLEDIEQLCGKFNINILNVYDEVMALKRDRLVEFCKGVKKFGLKWVTEFRINMVDRDLLRMMKDAGCYLINFGIENVNDSILKSMDKRITRKQIEDTLQLCYEEEIGATGNILMLDTAETLETARFSLDWLRKNTKYTICCVPVQPYPGSRLHKEYVEKKVIDDKEFMEAGCPFPIKPPAMSEDDFRTIMDEYYNYRRLGDVIPGGIITMRVSSIESRGPLYAITTVCPHCKRSDLYQNVTFSTYMASDYPEGERVRLGCRYCNAKFDITKRGPTKELVQT